MVKNSIHLFFMMMVVVVLSMVGSGCASFHGNNLPSRYQSDISTPVQLGTVGFNAKWFTFGNPNPGMSSMFREKVRNHLVASGMFSDVIGDCSTETTCLEFTMNNDGNRGVAFITGYLSGLTLTVLPAYARDDYAMTVDLKKDGNLLKTYEYKDSMKTWIQLFMIFMAGNTSEKVGNEVRENIYWNFLYDLHNDGAIVCGDLTKNTQDMQ
ncbi:MAG: hypothetical protein KKC46_20145 [Proteobacteria bacterium]|nr:hypothetical protein [Pseudomonadota bacterium]